MLRGPHESATLVSWSELLFDPILRCGRLSSRQPHLKLRLESAGCQLLVSVGRLSVFIWNRSIRRDFVGVNRRRLDLAS